jgi:hypothetical protein
MTKETPELITECWQLLVEYIPKRDHAAAAEQLFSYLSSVLSKEEQEAIADLDSDLSEAYNIVSDDEDEYEEMFDDDPEECD